MSCYVMVHLKAAINTQGWLTGALCTKVLEIFTKNISLKIFH